MSYTITYPSSGDPPILHRGESYIGILEPVDPTEIELDSFAFYLKTHPIEPPAGTAVRIGFRTFASIRSAVVAYFHLA
ncbi:MAG: hypothetical protein ACHQX3_11000 [Nitrospirales bacterium]|jgi:hypothetical protein